MIQRFYFCFCVLLDQYSSDRPIKFFNILEGQMVRLKKVLVVDSFTQFHKLFYVKCCYY